MTAPIQVWGALAEKVETLARSAEARVDALRPLVPRARVDALPGVGHFPMSEAPRSVAAAIRGTLR